MSTQTEFGDALIAALEETVAFLAARETLPYSEPLAWVVADGGGARRESVRLPQVGGLQPRAREELFGLPGWKRFRKALRRDPVANAHFEPGFVLCGGETRLQLNNLRLLLLNEYFTRVRGLRFDQAVAASLAADLAAFFAADSVVLELCAPLWNLKNDAPLQLADDAAIVALDVATAARVHQAKTETYDTSAAWALSVRFSHDKSLDVEHPTPAWPASARAEDCTNALLDALAELGAGGVTIPAWIVEQTRWTPRGGGVRRLDHNAVPPETPTITLDASTRDRLPELWTAARVRREADRGAPKPAPRFSELPLPRVPYVSIHSLHLECEEPLQVQVDQVRIAVTPGPLEVSYSAPRRASTPRSVAMLMDVATKRFEPDTGPYLVLQTPLALGPTADERALAKLRIAEALALVELRHPGLIVDHLYEGVAGPGIFAPDGPVRVTLPAPRDPRDVLTSARDDLARVTQLPDALRQRFRLAARWYTRGRKAANLVDKLLFYWTALEVHPGHGTPDIPGAVSDYLRQALGREEDRATMKQKLYFSGPMSTTSLRASIVHDGVAYVPPDEMGAWSARVDCLEAIVGATLRLAAGTDAAELLKRYLDE